MRSVLLSLLCLYGLFMRVRFLIVSPAPEKGAHSAPVYLRVLVSHALPPPKHLRLERELLICWTVSFTNTTLLVFKCPACRTLDACLRTTVQLRVRGLWA